MESYAKEQASRPDSDVSTEIYEKYTLEYFI